MRYISNSSSTSFYSTYEELKHKNTYKNLSKTIGFYSTYEELKLYCLSWNLDFILKFLQYLWGIETQHSVLSYSKVLSSFLQYLWGIETWFYPCFKFVFHMSFYSTYEELKQEIASKYNLLICTFLQYLWGIETGISE